MSDLEDSTVTFTEASSPFEDLSDIGSSGVDGLPMIPQDPYAYVETSLQASPSPDYFMPPEDDVLPAKEQPLPSAVSPTTDSPRYIPEFDLDENPEEDLDEDKEYPEEDPADYPTDRKDDEKEEESFGDDANDEEEDEDDDEDEE
nr:hypothetical protein [Tanacetum cinerariifolium]